MNLDELIKRNYELCNSYPSITNETKLLNEYWQGFITYEQYLNKLKELKKEGK